MFRRHSVSWILVLVCVALQRIALADATVTASGYAFCYDGTTQKFHPLAGARVELMDSDCDGSQICDDEMGRSYVQADGSYSVTGSGGDPGIFGTDPDVYVRFAYNDDQGVRLTDEANSTRSWSVPEHDHDNFGGGNIDFGTWSTGNGVAAKEGTQCGVWLRAHEEFAAYKTEVGSVAPAGHLDVEYWSAIWAGTPWTNTDTIHWPIHHPSSAMSHEFGHSIRHAADGDGAHFSYDVTRFQYARSHSACASDANRNPSESDQSLRSYGFNEGWAQYWSNGIGGCGAPSAVDEFSEGVIAKNLYDLQIANNLQRKDLVRVLLNNPGNIHTLDEFRSRLAEQLGVRTLRPSLNVVQERADKTDIPAMTEEMRRRNIALQIREVRSQIGRLRGERDKYARLSVAMPASGSGRLPRGVAVPITPCHGADCQKLFSRAVSPALIDAEANALGLWLSLLEKARGEQWPTELRRIVNNGEFDKWLSSYRADASERLARVMTEGLARATRNVEELRSSVEPEALAQFMAELSEARARVLGGDAREAWRPQLRLIEDAAARQR